LNSALDAHMVAGSTKTDLSKTEYLGIRARLDFQPNVAPNLAIAVLDVLILVVVWWLMRQDATATFLVSQVLLAIVFFNAFSILHECGHASLSKSRLVNVVVGHVASIFCFIPYFSWQYIHQKHHLWTGNVDNDPVLKSLRRFRDRGVPGIVRLSWLTWIPLAALMQHLVYLAYPLALRTDPEASPGRLIRCALSTLFLLGVHLALWVGLRDLFSPGNFALAFVIFLVAEEMVNLPHHVDMPTSEEKLPPWRQYRATRSCYYPRWVSELLVLNFNFHIEHHLFPSLPWYRLRVARSLIQNAIGDKYTERKGISWNLQNRTRDLDTIVQQYRSGLETETT
jgi:acyl-lipid omega-6 desaturase (Delta-12 desaturase)